MSLNIKNKRTHELVHELAALTGESQAEAVAGAVEEKLAALRQRQRGGVAEQMLAIGREMAARIDEPYRSADHGDLLYDENGMPT